jgi:tetratricopeptide (TPR) repeat protein
MLRWTFTALLAALMLPGAASAEWVETKSPHFIIYTEQSADEARAYAARLERFDQAVRVAHGLRDRPLTDANRLTVYVLRDERAIGDFVGSRGVHGFYIGRASGAVAFVHRGRPSRDEWELKPEPVFFHEYTHHLMLSALGGNALPAWMTEGYAEFFGTAELLDDGGVQIGAQPRHRAYGLFSMGNETLTVRDMVGATYKNLTGPQVESIYGKGWLLTHYMAFEPSRRGQISKYVRAIQEGHSALEAAETSFGDLGQLDKILEAYLRRKKVDVRIIKPAQIHVGAIAVRPLGPGENAAMEVILQSQRGVDKTQAPGVARRARQIGKRFPADPVVLAALAEAEIDAGNHELAIAAADRALAVDPASSKALIMRAKAMMAANENSPGKADWTAIRGWLAKANRLDPEDAEALVLFYQTYEKSGQGAPASVVDGLFYALDMVPQDSNLRLSVVRQLLAQNKVEAARKEYGPIAYYPHQSKKERFDNDAVMKLLIAKDAKGASAEIDRQLLEDRKKKAG